MKEKDDLIIIIIIKNTFSRTPSRGEMFFVCVERSEKMIKKNGFNNEIQRSYAQRILKLIMPDNCN